MCLCVCVCVFVCVPVCVSVCVCLSVCLSVSGRERDVGSVLDYDGLVSGVPSQCLIMVGHNLMGQCLIMIGQFLGYRASA